MKSAAVRAVIGLAMALPFAALAASITHQPIAYFVPEKRIRIDAGIVDLSGVKTARVYFKAGAQADYLFVPMSAAGGHYVAMLPAPGPSVSSIEYVLLAQNNDGQVSRTEAYRANARRTNQTPAWQSAGGQGEVKVFTELPDAPAPVAMYSDSIAMDVVESGARLGAAAGLYAGAAGGAAGSATAATTSSSTATSTTAATATSSTAATTTAATTATVGGLSTAAIIGGVVVAGAAAAAAGGGGGGGGGSPSTGGGGGGGAPTVSPFAGTWSGSYSVRLTPSNNSICGIWACSGTWTGTVNNSGFYSASGTGTCTDTFSNPTNVFTHPGSGDGWSGQIDSAGNVTVTEGGSGAIAGGNCQSIPLHFSASPKSVTGGTNCSGPGAGGCTYTGTWSITGN